MNGDLAVEDRHNSEREKVVEDTGLEAILFLVKTRVILKKNYQDHRISVSKQFQNI